MCRPDVSDSSSQRRASSGWPRPSATSPMTSSEPMTPRRHPGSTQLLARPLVGRVPVAAGPFEDGPRRGHHLAAVGLLDRIGVLEALADRQLGRGSVHDPRRQDGEVAVPGHAHSTQSRRRARPVPPAGRHASRPGSRPSTMAIRASSRSDFQHRLPIAQRLASSRAASASARAAVRSELEEPVAGPDGQQQGPNCLPLRRDRQRLDLSSARSMYSRISSLGAPSRAGVDRNRLELPAASSGRPASRYSSRARVAAATHSSLRSIAPAASASRSHTVPPAHRPAGHRACSQWPAGRARTPRGGRKSCSPRALRCVRRRMPGTGAPRARSAATRGRCSTPPGS